MSDTRMTDTTYRGRVKWFNNKAGYGFITVIEGDGDKIGMDIFAHHSAICVSEEQYKYLVQGEYLEFSINSVDSTDNYKYQAVDIRGMRGGKLLCETRKDTRTSVSQRPSSSPGRSRQHSRPRGGGPRAVEEESEWTLANTKPPKLQREESVFQNTDA